ncbi:type II toxin-antitoxin system VapB family antitoxin [Pseudomonas sp. HR96]|uniref:antitoxin n=1 Tax=Pseudomonas sp. HR96 TaxID=1027966 RepID=UPI002A760156|nr:type II toxin-antitoxin system VapB family antitoxin [Pseudomonas sp. HR96]WPP00988.1 type II toxin-antitoxin system VapB family antitoxin [Pseudomonas sp. HR96]
MAFARVFQSGNSQAVRLPKEFRLNTDRVEIFRRGEEIVLRQITINASAIFDALASLPDDFMIDGRDYTHPQDREDF